MFVGAGFMDTAVRFQLKELAFSWRPAAPRAGMDVNHGVNRMYKISPRIGRACRLCALPAALALAGTIGLAGPSFALEVRSDLKAQDLDLPAFPGAISSPGNDADVLAFSLKMSESVPALVVAAANYRSRGSVDAVAAYYRAALARFGEVLECTGEPAQGCGGDRPEPGGRLLEVGPRADRRLVGVKPLNGGVAIQLARIQSK
ncbi:MAG: hypothetical protein ABW005_01285 [Burkholderiaceae bacterium]